MGPHSSSSQSPVARGRLARRVLKTAELRARAAVLLTVRLHPGTLTIDDLASKVDADRAMVEEALARLQHEGVLEAHDDGVRFREPSRLRANQMRVLGVVVECLARGIRPPVETLGAITGLSRNAVTTILGELERLGFLIADPATGSAVVVRTPQDGDEAWRFFRESVVARLEHPELRSVRARALDARASRDRTFATLLLWTAKHLRPPSRRELGAATGLSAQAIVKHYEALEREGYLVRVPGSSDRLVARLAAGSDEESGERASAASSLAVECVIAAVRGATPNRGGWVPVAQIASRVAFTPSLARRLVAELAARGVVEHDPVTESLREAASGA